MSGPSVIPPKGRALEDSERDALLADIEDIVESSHLFKTLDAAGRQELIVSGYVVEYQEGEILMRQGDTGSVMYLVMQGRISVATDKGAGSSIILAELGRGAWIGEVALLTGSPRTATVKALEDARVVAFEKHRVMRVIDAYPKVRALLEAMIEGRARDTVEKLISS